MSLLNAFYVTNATQTIIFAIFVSMNPPTLSPHRTQMTSKPDPVFLLRLFVHQLFAVLSI